ncbi:MAG: hypothetical protein INR73_14880 [Williamsia sp.]|nr:hypothetical protein [Williamsia sp.]
MKQDRCLQVLVALAGCMCWMVAVHAQPQMETGAQQSMPPEWIDQDTHHKIVRLSRLEGNNASFYFHNNPFVGNRMVFYNTGKEGKQIWTVDLASLKLETITNFPGNKNGEIVAPRSGNIYYQIADTVFRTNIHTKKTERIFVFPADYRASITTVNADETRLAGSKASDEQKEILKQYPEKSQYFNRIYDAKLLNELFTIDIKKGELKKIHHENTWLGHVQFSPSDPNLLMFCHEGPWQKVDRIWHYNLQTGAVQLMHKRTVENEIAGHEFFGPDGKTIWFDLQIPRSVTFYLAGTDVRTGKETRYSMERNEWSIHFNASPDQKLFCGDGGDPGQVAKAPDGMWLYLFRPQGDQLVSEKLVNMKHHNYKLEPNVHFSPDGKWIIFRANFEGTGEVYAVEIKKS